MVLVAKPIFDDRNTCAHGVGPTVIAILEEPSVNNSAGRGEAKLVPASSSSEIP